MYDDFSEFIKVITDFIWRYPAPLLLMSLFIYFTVRTHAVQLKVFKGIRASLKPTESKTESPASAHGSCVSSFSSLAATLAATLGTGNIIGLSLAVALGGPGAVFWCWLTGVLGMACSYAESFICVKHKTPGHAGGPMDVLKKTGCKRLAFIYAAGVILCSLFTSASIQSRAISDAVHSCFYTPYLLCGIITALAVFLTVSNGSDTVHKVCNGLVPFMAILFSTGLTLILAINFKYVPQAIGLIVKSAFAPCKCLTGVGSYAASAALRHGIARGIFTNEAGLGTSALPSTETNNPPHTQALIAMSATFWDTVVLCGITGIAIVSCMLKSPAAFSDLRPENYITAAFSFVGSLGAFCLNLSIIVFAFATLIGWAHFGSIACNWIKNPLAVKCYPYVYSAMCVLGACKSISSLFTISDLSSIVLLVCNCTMLIKMRCEVGNK